MLRVHPGQEPDERDNRSALGDQQTGDPFNRLRFAVGDLGLETGCLDVRVGAKLRDVTAEIGPKLRDVTAEICVKPRDVTAEIGAKLFDFRVKFCNVGLGRHLSIEILGERGYLGIGKTGPG